MEKSEDGSIWMKRRPSLRFAYKNTFLQLRSSTAKIHSLDELTSPIRPSQNNIPVVIADSPIIKQRSNKNRHSPDVHECVSSIVRAAETHKASLKKKNIQNIRDLRKFSTSNKREWMEAKAEKKHLNVLLREIRTKCQERLKEQRHPMIGAYMRALNESFLSGLLGRYQGYSLSVDAVLALIGSSTTIAGDNLQQQEEQHHPGAPTLLDPSFFFAQLDEQNMTIGMREGDASLPQISPNSPTRRAHHHRPLSPIRMVPGAGYRPFVSAVDDSNSTNKVQFSPANTNDRDHYAITVLTESEKKYEEYNNLASNRSNYMNFSSVTDTTQFQLSSPLKPYIPTKKTGQSYQGKGDDILYPALALEKFKEDRKKYLDSLDGNKRIFPIKVDRRISYTLDSEGIAMKQDMYGVWRPKRRDKKKSARPFISTT